MNTKKGNMYQQEQTNKIGYAQSYQHYPQVYINTSCL